MLNDKNVAKQCFYFSLENSNEGPLRLKIYILEQQAAGSVYEMDMNERLLFQFGMQWE